MPLVSVIVPVYNGQKYILHDVIRDRTGNYRNSAIYEIIFNGEEKK